MRYTRGVCGGLALIGLVFAAILPGVWTLPPMDRDEARFAEASRHMVEAKAWADYVVPVFDGKPRLNKPPLIYWLQTLAMKSVAALGVTPQDRPGLAMGGIGAYRLPSLLGALLAVLFTWRLGCSMHRGPVGWMAGALLSASLIVAVDARQARVDEVLLAWTVLAQWALWEIWIFPSRTLQPPRSSNISQPLSNPLIWVLLFWIAIGLGILTKGPITPGISFLTILALSIITRRWRWIGSLRPVSGALLVLVMVAPWVIAVGRVVGWRTWAATIWRETGGRGTGTMEGHWGPPGYYLLLLPIAFWPGSLFLLPALARAAKIIFFNKPQASACATFPCNSASIAPANHGPARTPDRAAHASVSGRSAELFCLAWLVPAWMLFELMATKLPHYTLPLYPALALLCARVAMGGRRHWIPILANPWGRAALAGWAALTGAILFGVPLSLGLLGQWSGSPWGWPALFLTAGVALAAYVKMGRCLWQLTFRAEGGVSSAKRRSASEHPRGLKFAARHGTSRIWSWLLVAATALNITLFSLLLPNLRQLWLSSRIVSRVEEVDPTGRRPLCASGYVEDSLVFLTKGRVERLGWAEVADWLKRHPDGLLILDSLPPGISSELPELGVWRGFNYSKGESVTVRLMASEHRR